jgi:hypothetical protein
MINYVRYLIRSLRRAGSADARQSADTLIAGPPNGL